MSEQRDGDGVSAPVWAERLDRQKKLHAEWKRALLDGDAERINKAQEEISDLNSEVLRSMFFPDHVGISLTTPATDE